jgi:ABC-type phosphate transport system substrate-binding protein
MCPLRQSLPGVGARANKDLKQAVRSKEQKMKLKQALLGVAAMLLFVVANAHAQTIQLAIIGSSAQFLELGQAETTTTTAGCWWTDGTKGDIDAQDTGTGASILDKATLWITWTVGGGTGCSSPGSSSVINLMANTDSVVGNRCFFRANSDNTTGCYIDVITACTTLAAQPGSNLLGSSYPDNTTGLPSGICSAITSKNFNVAASDIRPEDAKFAINRALASGGSQMFPGSQYIGLGYTNGSTISGSTLGLGSSFNVVNFNIVGDDPFNTTKAVPVYAVTQLGAVPEVVFVNSSQEPGFGNIAVSNLSRATLAGYLDGTYLSTADAIQTGAFVSGAGNSSTVFIREPLSGTYNTMEYSVPDNLEIQSSQDCGLESYNSKNNLWTSNAGVEIHGLATPPWNCVTGGTETNPIAQGTPGVNRAIGTGNEVASVIATQDSLGYAFWSAANFAGVSNPSGAKYLTVDGVDPIQEVWVDGEIPTAGNGLLGNVSMSHVKDGSYPIWSFLRLVSNTTNQPTVQSLVNTAVRFLSPTQPDFVPTSQMFIVRSHFAPPGVDFKNCTAGYTPPVGADGTGGTACPATSVDNGDAGGTAENGGDVGGLIYSFQSDGDYNSTNSVETGHIGKRQ